MNLVVDASALVAIAFREPEEPVFTEILLRASGKVMSPVNFWEALVRVRSAYGVAGAEMVEDLMKAFAITVEPVTERHARLAVEAFARFGKGQPAKLNLGDCFAYALAQDFARPLLFKGLDFPQTDILDASASK